VAESVKVLRQVGAKTEKARRSEVEVAEDEIAAAGIRITALFSNFDVGRLMEVTQSSTTCHCTIRY
jgi:hypothetical protein